MSKKDLNECFNKRHSEVMGRAKDLFTELFKRAMLCRAIAENNAPPEVASWDELIDWIMNSDSEDVALVTKYMLALLKFSNDYRDLPEPFEQIFTK